VDTADKTLTSMVEWLASQQSQYRVLSKQMTFPIGAVSTSRTVPDVEAIYNAAGPPGLDERNTLSQYIKDYKTYADATKSGNNLFLALNANNKAIATFADDCP